MHLTFSRNLAVALVLAVNSLLRHANAQSQALSSQTTTAIGSTVQTTSSHSLISATTLISSHSSRTLTISSFSDIYPSYTATPTSSSGNNNNNNNNNDTDTENDDNVWDTDKTAYYYIFIAVFIIAGLCVLWITHRRRRIRRLRRRNGRQNALLQDAAGWPNNRRWIHGNRTGAGGDAGDGGEGRTGSGWDTNRNEGLDERGEAPPPYKPANQPDVQPVDLAVGEGSSARGSGEIAVPARVADRTKPPEYEERRV